MLTQSEADALLSLEKQFVDTNLLILGKIPISESHDLVSLDGKEKFILDIWRGSINLKKYKYNNRSRKIHILARVDIGGSPHQNPDGVIVPCPHIHVYREGYDDKWAYPLKDFPFRDPENMIVVLEDFARFCHIILLPPLQLKAC